jgi:4-amino-4-deoxy-L-arabinose transferase-like glycosyltransferase
VPTPAALRSRADRRFRLALLAVVGAALAVRVAYLVVVDPRVGDLSDATAYHLLGRHLADGLGFVRPFDHELFGLTRPTAEYPPLFPALLGGLTLLGLDTVDGQRCALCVVGAATVGVTGLVGRRIGGPAVGVVAASLAALSPMMVQADAVLMTESLAMLLAAACVLLALRVAAAPTAGRLVALGVALGGFVLTRSEGLLLAPLLVLPLSARLPGSARQRAAGVAVALGVAAAVVLPWTIRNAARFDTVVPVSNNLGTVLDGANCDLTYRGTALGSWRYLDRTVNPAGDCFEGFVIEDPGFDEAAAAARHRRDGVRYAREHAGDWPRVVAARIGRTWGLFRPGQQASLEALEGRDLRVERAATRVGWVLAAVALAGLVLLVRRGARAWPLVAPLVLVTVTSAITYGNQRFRAPAEPALAVLAAVALVAVARRDTSTPA